MYLPSIQKIYQGTTPVLKIFQGEVLVWPRRIEIIYTTIDGEILDPDTTYTIVSNTYSGGVGRLVLEGTTEIQDMMYFYAEQRLTSIIIPEGVTRIGISAFGQQINLTAVTLPSTLRVIDETAFIECRMSEITFNSDVKIMRGAFEICPELTDVYPLGNITTGIVDPDLGDLSRRMFFHTNINNASVARVLSKVDRLTAEMFENCDNITSVTIPKRFTAIPRWLFSGCDNLETINYQGTTSEWQNIEIENDNWHNGCPATVVHCSNGNIPL